MLIRTQFSTLPAYEQVRQQAETGVPPMIAILAAQRAADRACEPEDQQ
jgi:hypothetical protein